MRHYLKWGSLKWFSMSQYVDNTCKWLDLRGEIHQSWNSTILVFNISMKNYASRENCDSKAWWISTLVYLVSLKAGGFACPLTSPSTRFRKWTSNLLLLGVLCIVEPAKHYTCYKWLESRGPFHKTSTPILAFKMPKNRCLKHFFFGNLNTLFLGV